MKPYIKFFSFLPIIVILVYPELFYTHKEFSSAFYSDKEMEIGEEINYVVKYGFIKLGEVRLKVIDKKTDGKKSYYRTVAYIDSYSGIPFVNLHQIYESNVDNEYYSDYFKGIVKGDEYSTFTEYRFNYAKNKIAVMKGKIRPYELWNDSTTSAENKKYQDGLSIFYFARMNLGENNTVKIPCYVAEKKVYTVINFHKNVSKVEIDAVNYGISCLYLDGNAEFVSVYGLSGYFQGWFSNDKASIPIIAKMKVIVGNITLELKSWKREGWKPPIYKD